MRSIMKVAALLWILPSAAAAQQSDMLQLSSAKPSERVAQQLKQDWREMSSRGHEWAYCVTGWSVGFTAAHDSIYIVEDVKLKLDVDVTKHSVESFKQLGCEDSTGRLLPIIHAHPAGDCTPSRADVLVAIVRRKAPFQMILCSETSTISYSGGVYEDAALYRFSQSFDVTKYNKP